MGFEEVFGFFFPGVFRVFVWLERKLRKRKRKRILDLRFYAVWLLKKREKIQVPTNIK